MANPNIVNVTQIYGNTLYYALGTTITSLKAGSANNVLKMNTIIVANIDGTNDATCDLGVLRSSVLYYFAKGINVPANSSLIVSSKDTAFYLEESDVLQGLASAASDLQVSLSYEVITDT